MKIYLEDGLPIISILLTYNGKRIQLDNVLLDTGFPPQSLIRMKLKMWV
jgi:hypothetical protein